MKIVEGYGYMFREGKPVKIVFSSLLKGVYSTKKELARLFRKDFVYRKKQTGSHISCLCFKMQSTLFIPTLDSTTKFVIMTILLPRNLRERGNN